MPTHELTRSSCHKGLGVDNALKETFEKILLPSEKQKLGIVALPDTQLDKFYRTLSRENFAQWEEDTYGIKFGNETPLSVVQKIQENFASFPTDELQRKFLQITELAESGSLYKSFSVGCCTEGAHQVGTAIVLFKKNEAALVSGHIILKAVKIRLEKKQIYAGQRKKTFLGMTVSSKAQYETVQPNCTSAIIEGVQTYSREQCYRELRTISSIGQVVGAVHKIEVQAKLERMHQMHGASGDTGPSIFPEAGTDDSSVEDPDDDNSNNADASDDSSDLESSDFSIGPRFRSIHIQTDPIP